MSLSKGSELEQVGRLERAGSELERAERQKRAGNKLGVSWEQAGASWSKLEQAGMSWE